MINVSKEELKPFGPFNKCFLLGGGSILLRFGVWLKSTGFEVKVITSPRQSNEYIGNGKLTDTLKDNGIEFLVTESVESDIVANFIDSSDDAFFLSIGAAWIFRTKSISNIFNNVLFNLHGSRLPQNRGGGGFSWQILTNNKFGFCVLHFVDEGIDTGNIIQFEEFLYPATCRIPIEYEKIYIEKNLSFLKKFVKSTHSKVNYFQHILQQEYFSSYWPRLNTEINGWVDWSLSALEIERFICAFDNPYDGAKTYINNNTLVKLKRVMLSQQDGMFHSYQSGIIYRRSDGWICVALKHFSLIIEEVYNDSGENITNQLQVGDRFFTPMNKIESSKLRVIYTPKEMKINNNSS
jgi:methionyl-tRNA formyltransferase